MTDHGQHDQGETPFTSADVARAIQHLKDNRYGDGDGLDSEDLDEIVRIVLTAVLYRRTRPLQPGDDGRRAAQIRAADDVRWAQVEVVKILLRRLVDDDATRDGFAAEVVDAVLAAGSDLDDEAHDECHARVMATRQAAVNGFAELRLQLLGALGLVDDQRTPLTGYIAQLIAQRDQARAAGYAAAVAELRGVVQRTGSPAARWAADYLEAVGPRKDQKLTEEKTDG